MADKDKKNKDKVIAFVKDLKALLEKHKADIGFNCGDGSDTYGLYEEEMTATVDGVDITLASGWGVSASDL